MQAAMESPVLDRNLYFFIYSVKKKMQHEMLQNDVTAVKNHFKILEDSATGNLVAKLRKNFFPFALCIFERTQEIRTSY